MVLLIRALTLLAATVAAIPSPESNSQDLDITSKGNQREGMPSRRDFGKHFEWLEYAQKESKSDDMSHSKTLGSEHSESKRKDPVYGIYECAQPNFSGICKWTQVFLGEKKCHNQAFTTLGSLGPDASVVCTVYSAPDCAVTSVTAASKDGFVYPGVKDCTAGNFWDVAPGRVACPSSWTCEVHLVRDTTWVGNE